MWIVEKKFLVRLVLASVKQLVFQIVLFEVDRKKDSTLNELLIFISH